MQTSYAQIQFKPGGFDNSVVDLAISVNQSSGEFSTLIAALQEAGLVGVLDRFGPFTVFAPTDAAFAELGITPSNLGSNIRLLQAILLYHVAFGDFFASDVFSVDSLSPLAGVLLRPRQTLSGAFIVDQSFTPARVLVDEELFDLAADNGVVHVIDNVLLFKNALR